MKSRRNLIICAFFFACIVPVALAQPMDQVPKPNEMTVWRARRVLNVNCETAGSICLNARISGDTLSFETQRGRNKPPELHSIDLRALDRLTADCRYHGFGKGRFLRCDVVGSNGKDLDRHHPAQQLFFSGYWGYASASDANAVQQVTLKGEMFVSALNRLHEHAIRPESPLRNFSKVAVEWRALPTKPPLSEDARVHRLIAEDEVKKKHPALALYHYEAALEIQPTWPEGYFNAALIAAELEQYGQAAEHMQSYLELIPDAQDAQTARDQVAMWKYKAKNK
jgi:hypothetical protein